MEKIQIENRELSAEARLREFLDLAMLKRKEKEKMEISDAVEDLGDGLPAELKLKLEKDYRRLEGKISNKKDLKEEVELAGRNIRESYMDKSLNIPNKAFINLDLMSKIDELFDQEKVEVSDLQKVAHVYFDLNGLKAVNDLGGHGFGDEYLKLATEAIGSKKARETAEKNGINRDYLVCREGGDEFGVVLKSEKPISKEALEEFIGVVQMTLWEDNRVDNVLDFDNPEIVAKFAGVSFEEIKKEFQSDMKKFKSAHNIPSDYKYKGAISAGASRIYDALLSDEVKSKNRIEKKDSYEKILQKGMGATLDVSGSQMMENKKKFKSDLAKGEVGDDFENDQERERAIKNAQMLARVYTRTEEEKGLVERVQELEEALKKEAQLKEDIKNLIEAGGNATDILRFLEKEKN